jgi:hypothetical protein
MKNLRYISKAMRSVLLKKKEGGRERELKKGKGQIPGFGVILY